MTDTVDPGTTDEQVAAVAGMEPAEAPMTAPEQEAATDAAAKVVKNQLKPCFCSYFEVGKFDGENASDDEVFTTGCNQQTKRTFAQGHDARLVSFLVDGYFDGYDLRLVEGGVATSFSDPAMAAARASDSLRDKAEKATKNRKEKIDASGAKKAEREKAKAEAAAAKEKLKAERAAAAEAKKAEKEAAKTTQPQAEVAAGSREGDLPELPEGVVRVKVGRWEYDATIDESGAATYIDGKGDTQTTERDGYRLLEPQNA